MPDRQSVLALLNRSRELHMATSHSLGSLGCVVSELGDLAGETGVQAARQNLDTWRRLGHSSSNAPLRRAKQLFESYFAHQSPESKYSGVDSVLDRLELCRVLFASGRDDFRTASALLETMINDWDTHISPLLSGQQAQDLLSQVLLFSGAAFCGLGDVERGNTRFAEAAQLGPPPAFSKADVLLLIGRNLELQYERQSGVASLTGALVDGGDVARGSQRSVSNHSHSNAPSAAHEESYRSLHYQLLSEQRQGGQIGARDAVPDDVDDWLADRRTWLSRADLLQTQGLLPLAIDFYGQALTRDPKGFGSVAIWLRLAKCCHRCGRLRDALLALQQGLSRLPARGDAPAALQMLRLQQRWQAQLSRQEGAVAAPYSPGSSASSVSSKRRPSPSKQASPGDAAPPDAPPDAAAASPLLAAERAGLLSDDGAPAGERLRRAATALLAIAAVRSLLCRLRLGVGCAVRVLDAPALLAAAAAGLVDPPRRQASMAIDCAVEGGSQLLRIAARTWGATGAVTAVHVAVHDAATRAAVAAGCLSLPTPLAPPRRSLRAQRPLSIFLATMAACAAEDAPVDGLAAFRLSLREVSLEDLVALRAAGDERAAVELLSARRRTSDARAARPVVCHRELRLRAVPSGAGRAPLLLLEELQHRPLHTARSSQRSPLPTGRESPAGAAASYEAYAQQALEADAPREAEVWTSAYDPRFFYGDAPQPQGPLPDADEEQRPLRDAFYDADWYYRQDAWHAPYDAQPALQQAAYHDAAAAATGDAYADAAQTQLFVTEDGYWYYYDAEGRYHWTRPYPDDAWQPAATDTTATDAAPEATWPTDAAPEATWPTDAAPEA
eukprot:gene950-681_t